MMFFFIYDAHELLDNKYSSFILFINDHDFLFKAVLLGIKLQHLYCNDPDLWLQWCLNGHGLRKWVLMVTTFHKCFMVKIC